MTQDASAPRLFGTRCRPGDVPFSTTLPEAVGAAFEEYCKANNLPKRAGVLAALRALGMPVAESDLEDLRGRYPHRRGARKQGNDKEVEGQ